MNSAQPTRDASEDSKNFGVSPPLRNNVKSTICVEVSEFEP